VAFGVRLVHSWAVEANLLRRFLVKVNLPLPRHGPKYLCISSWRPRASNTMGQMMSNSQSCCGKRVVVDTDCPCKLDQAISGVISFL